MSKYLFIIIYNDLNTKGVQWFYGYCLLLWTQNYDNSLANYDSTYTTGEQTDLTRHWTRWQRASPPLKHHLFPPFFYLSSLHHEATIVKPKKHITRANNQIPMMPVNTKPCRVWIVLVNHTFPWHFQDLKFLAKLVICVYTSFQLVNISPLLKCRILCKT